jgi:hypothetical protein
MNVNFTPPDYYEVRSKKWFRLCYAQALARELTPSVGEIILVNEKGQYVFNSHLYFTDAELDQIELLPL